MRISTSLNLDINSEFLRNYFKYMVNCFFKILPLREEEEKTLTIYMRSLQVELMGCKSLISHLDNDAMFLTLLAILQYLIDNPTCPVYVVKREVFKAISVCNELERKYSNDEVKT